jgi:hypothetical protein
MKSTFLPTDPYLFRVLKRSAVALMALLLLFAAWLPAPLQGPADPSRSPDSVKAAWFLVWIQELVSYSNLLIYPVMAVGIGFLLLPFFPRVQRAEFASWFAADRRVVTMVVLGILLLIVLLTLIALFFRGDNWQFVFVF